MFKGPHVSSVRMFEYLVLVGLVWIIVCSVLFSCCECIT